MKILIIGDGRHGKDTVAEIIRDEYGLEFISSSWFLTTKVVYPAMQTHYKDAYECYEDRHAHRLEWKVIIRSYNADDPARLAKEVLEEADIYVGLRDRDEFDAAKGLFDAIVWVERPGYSRDYSNDLTPQDATHGTILNDGDLEQLRYNVCVAMDRILAESKTCGGSVAKTRHGILQFLRATGVME